MRWRPLVFDHVIRHIISENCEIWYFKILRYQLILDRQNIQQIGNSFVCREMTKGSRAEYYWSKNKDRNRMRNSQWCLKKDICNFGAENQVSDLPETATNRSREDIPAEAWLNLWEWNLIPPSIIHRPCQGR